MAHTKFTDDELKQRLFFELVKYPDGASHQRTEFHGFFTDEVLMDCRITRQSWRMVENWHQRNDKPMPLSQYLYMLAGMFAEIETRAEKRDNPCAEVVLPTMDRMNLQASGDDRWLKCPAATPDIAVHRCPRCGATSDAAPFDPPGPTCRRVPCYGRGET